MKRYLKTITPQEASSILRTNINNRELDMTLVEEIKNDILNNTFDVENTFVVLKDGALYYGQHVLTAIVEANVPLSLNVVELEHSDGFHAKGHLNNNSKYKYRIKSL